MPNKTQPIPSNIQYRDFTSFELEENEVADNRVFGYAATFAPTTLYSFEGVDYKEVIDRNAFTDADMSDIIFNYNHGGKVLARTRNKTLNVKVDGNGLYIDANVGGTDEGRNIYEEIKGGYIDRMSFAFTIADESYNRDTHTRTILKIKKVWDVSAVDIPAYESTSISARGYFETEVEKLRAELENMELRKKLILETYF